MGRYASTLVASVKVTSTDRGATARLNSLLKRGALSIGLLGPEAETPHEDSSLTIGEIGAIHEFGLGTAPRRSFLADWADEKRADIEAIALKAGSAIARGKLDGAQALEQIGAWAVGSIQERMASNIPPPLAPATIQRKGSSVALIDTGQLRASISYRVDAAEHDTKASELLAKVGA